MTDEATVFVEPTPADRAKHAFSAILVYSQGSDEFYMSDFLADVMHLINLHPELTEHIEAKDPYEVLSAELETAYYHYQAELTEAAKNNEEETN